MEFYHVGGFVLKDVAFFGKFRPKRGFFCEDVADFVSSKSYELT